MRKVGSTAVYSITKRDEFARCVHGCSESTRIHPRTRRRAKLGYRPIDVIMWLFVSISGMPVVGSLSWILPREMVGRSFVPFLGCRFPSNRSPEPTCHKSQLLRMVHVLPPRASAVGSANQ